MCRFDWNFATCCIKGLDFIAGQATLKVASSKWSNMRKHDLTNRHANSSAQEVVSLLQRVQKVMNKNVVSPGAMNVIFKRIDFVFQKGLAAQLVARLSFIHM
jgi:hypothetical protein